MDIRPVSDWLDAGAPPASLAQDVLLHLARRLNDGGLSLYRIAVFVRTLHPNVVGRSFIWNADRDAVDVASAEWGLQESEQYLSSPVRIVFTQGAEVRRRLCDAGCPDDFPIL